MFLRLLQPGTLFLVAIQLTGFAQQSSVPPAQISAETATRRAEIRKIEESLPKIADRGGALFLLARRYAQVGELDKSLSLLKECVAMDEGFDPNAAPQFKPLQANPEFQQLVEQVQRRYPPVHRAHVAFTVSEMDLFPEGLAYDSGKRVFYMGSMHRKKIVKITEDGKVSDFVKPGVYNLLEIGGIKVDLDHGLWAASDNGGENSELLHFDAQGKLLERFSAPGEGQRVLNDLVLHSSNDVYVTDTAAHRVYRFDRKQHSFTPLSFPRPLFYPNGIALSDDGNLLYVADILGVIMVDLRKNSAIEVDPGKHSTLAGFDGLYWYKNSLLGVQYGTGGYRVIRCPLSADGSRATSTEVLEYRTSLVSFPTTGAIAEGNFYFIANTGIDNYNDDKVVDPKKLEPIHIAVVPLNK